VARVTAPITVTMTTWNRPAYLARTLAAWSQVRGVENTVFEFACEPGCDESIALCEAVNWTHRRITVNPVRLGHSANVLAVMNRAFQHPHADYAIQAVDDFLPSTDLLELHQWHRDRYVNDPTVLAFRSGTDKKQEGGLPAVWRTQLIGILSGFHQYKWQMLAARWDEHEQYDNWWWWIDEAWCIGGHWEILAPAVSRAEDIGEQGANPLPTSWAAMTAASSFVQDVPRQEYFEMPGWRERGFGRIVEAYQ
jgi:hypothetical protein